MRLSLVFLAAFFLGLNSWAGRIKSMKVSLSFAPEKTDLEIKVFQLPIDRAPDAGESVVTSLSEALPKMKSFDGGFMLKKGSIQPFLMVVENRSDRTKYFFAVSHTVVPETAAVGYRLGCLCNNHIFEIPPRSRWARVGVISLEQYAQGETVEFHHKIIGLTLDEIKEKGLEKNVNKAN